MPDFDINVLAWVFGCKLQACWKRLRRSKQILSTSLLWCIICGVIVKEGLLVVGCLGENPNEFIVVVVDEDDDELGPGYCWDCEDAKELLSLLFLQPTNSISSSRLLEKKILWWNDSVVGQKKNSRPKNSSNEMDQLSTIFFFFFAFFHFLRPNFYG